MIVPRIGGSVAIASVLPLLTVTLLNGVQPVKVCVPLPLKTTVPLLWVKVPPVRVKSPAIESVPAGALMVPADWESRRWQHHPQSYVETEPRSKTSA